MPLDGFAHSLVTLGRSHPVQKKMFVHACKNVYNYPYEPVAHPKYNTQIILYVCMC